MFLNTKIPQPILLKIIFYSIVGGLLFSLGDMAHVGFKIAAYSQKKFLLFNIPFWVPIEFSLASFFLIITTPLRNIFLKLCQSTFKLSEVFQSGMISLSVYFLSSIISEDYFIFKNILMMAILLIHLYLFKFFTLKNWLEIILISLIGCSIEKLLGLLNIFNYVESPSTIIGIPIWLLIIYMNLSISIRVIYGYFLSRRED